MNIRTKMIHTSNLPNKLTKALTVDITLSTVFAMETPDSESGFQYGRVGNPTREILEKTLADLHNAKNALVFSSGSAAISTLFSTLKTRDHIVCHNELYEGTLRILEDVFKKFGIQSSFVDLRDEQILRKEIKDSTKFIFIESPTNPMLTILDIKKIAKLAHAQNIKLIVDNTLATPVLQLPLALDADVVVESLTKAINGHTDVIAGMLATSDEELFQNLKSLQHTIGAILSPFDCFLILRGLKTLHLRILKQQESARNIVKFLKKNKNIDSVYFPDFPSSTSIKNTEGNGFVISFLVKGDSQNSIKFVKSLKIITIGHSFGGSESLIQQPATMMDLYLAKTMKLPDIPINFFRLSVGLEDVNDIISDLKQALKLI